MSLQDILQKIIKDAQKNAELIDAEFIAESKKLKDQAMADQKAALQKVEEKKLAALEKIQNEMDFLARKQSKSHLLASKNALINKALNQFLTHLAGLDDKAYGEILKKLFSALPMTTGTIFVPASRLALTKTLLPTGDFTVEVSDEINGGFILRSGKIEVDNSFKHLLYFEHRKALESFFIQELDLL